MRTIGLYPEKVESSSTTAYTGKQFWPIFRLFHFFFSYGNRDLWRQNPPRSVYAHFASLPRCSFYLRRKLPTQNVHIIKVWVLDCSDFFTKFLVVAMFKRGVHSKNLQKKKERILARTLTRSNLHNTSCKRTSVISHPNARSKPRAVFEKH